MRQEKRGECLVACVESIRGGGDAAESITYLNVLDCCCRCCLFVFIAAAVAAVDSFVVHGGSGGGAAAVDRDP